LVVARILGVKMGRTSWPREGLDAGRAWALAVSLLLAVTLLGSGPVLGVEPPTNAPQQPGTDELEAAAAQSLSNEPMAVELPDIAPRADRILEYAWSLPAEHWDIRFLAAELEFDPFAAFRFVRDYIRYEPYAGVLRGAEGTLAARAGNSLDRSLLLAALMDEMLVDYEFAWAHLDDATVAAVMDAAREGPPLQLDEELPGARIDTRDMAERARRDYAMLRRALTPHLHLDGGTDEAAAETDAREHVWLRIPFGPEVLDLDTTLPGAEPGATLADAERSISTLPDELRHTIHLQVILEELDDDVVSERVVLDESLDAIDASERELFLVFEPDLSGFAGAITAVLSGDERWSPVLLRDGERIEGEDFSAGGRGQDLLGDPTDLPEPVTLRLIATTEGPGIEPEQATHVLMDRRTDGQLPGSLVADSSFAPLTNEAGVPTALTGITNIQVSTGGSNPRTFAYRLVQVLDFISGALLDEDIAAQYSLADRLWPMAMTSEALVQTSEQVLAPAAGGGAGHGYVARPRVYVASLTPMPDDPEAFLRITDLVIDGVRVMPDVRGAPTAPSHLWYGVLQSALETEMGLRAADALAEDDPLLLSASLSMQQPLTVLTPEDRAAPDGIHAALRRDLESGWVVVLVGDAATADSWWAIDANSGVTRAMLASGLRGFQDVITPPGERARVFDGVENLWERRGRGSKSMYRKRYPSGGTHRGDGVDRRDLMPKKKPGLPKGFKFKDPYARVPKRPPPTPRCAGQNQEYMIPICAVSLPASGPLFFLGIIEGVSITAITYELLILMLE
jgi:hypothetical protein